MKNYFRTKTCLFVIALNGSSGILMYISRVILSVFLINASNSNHAKFIEVTHYLSHFVFRFRHFAVLMISEETRENCEKIVTYLSFHR